MCDTVLLQESDDDDDDDDDDNIIIIKQGWFCHRQRIELIVDPLLHEALVDE